MIDCFFPVTYHFCPMLVTDVKNRVLLKVPVNKATGPPRYDLPAVLLELGPSMRQ